MAYNKSKTYILPLVESEISLYKVSNIENTYLLNDSGELGTLYIKYNIEDKDSFLTYIDTIKQNIFFKNLYNKENCYIFAIEIPEKYITDINSLVEGCYSKFNEDSKIKIIKFLQKYRAPDKVCRDVHGILNKTHKRRKTIERELDVILTDENELGTIIDLKTEIINLGEYESISIT